ncbi:hypothetical protein [Pengzhenrongella sp.]|jgi:inositol transporter-like SP family MFS transporter|uniref:hypothetical protein n=1 Tax=Pengzhenrongella sp. TaxID=2888820 RepID=UPI002F9330E0
MVFLFGVYAFWNVVAGQMGIFMPRVYASAGVESPIEQNLLQVLLWGCTVASTYFGFMKLADRYSRRLLYIIGAALGIFAWLLLVYVEATMPVLILFAVSWGVAAGVGAQAFHGVWAPRTQGKSLEQIELERYGDNSLTTPDAVVAGRV